MKETEPIKRDEVVLTARVPTGLHERAKVKMAGRRGESFQNVIQDAIERYVHGIETPMDQVPPDAITLIAALHRELLQKKSEDISATTTTETLYALKMYLRDIRAILDKIDRMCEISATGDPLATVGADTSQPETVIVERGSPDSGNREASDSNRARDVIERTGRSVEGARRSTGRDQVRGQEKKHPRKKAG